MSESIMRGDLYYADLNPVVGSEQGGCRPILVIQNDTGNRHSPTIIVAAITGKNTKAILPTHCALGDRAGLDRGSLILLEQIRTIDKRRLKGYIGTLNPEDMQNVDQALALSMGLKRGVLE
ncbi:MAG: type II toxin-antitoxin system PemK/MazF family toxin [Coriobacteriales bacterium]|nr:type II toxin-antitoxin system PemK/MazF family toxin [Coriobacteriales bacterium]